jgi:mevalonate kinase
MTQTYHANGKLLLTGEYFILDGAVGLALPLNLVSHSALKHQQKKESFGKVSIMKIRFGWKFSFLNHWKLFLQAIMELQKHSRIFFSNLKSQISNLKSRLYSTFQTIGASVLLLH